MYFSFNTLACFFLLKCRNTYSICHDSRSLLVILATAQAAAARSGYKLRNWNWQTACAYVIGFNWLYSYLHKFTRQLFTLLVHVKRGIINFFILIPSYKRNKLKQGRPLWYNTYLINIGITSDCCPELQELSHTWYILKSWNILYNK